jgi:hypothetical protein
MSDRLAALFSDRLGALASAAERLGAPPAAVERLLTAASVATMRALALRMLTDRKRDDAQTSERGARRLRDAA